MDTSRSHFYGGLAKLAVGVFVLILVPFGGNGFAQPAMQAEPVDAESIIDRCWSISREDWSSGVTARLRNGYLTTALCLEKEIVRNASHLSKGSELDVQSLRKKMKDLRFLYGRFYWDLGNENQACLPWCGTENKVTHNLKLALLYERILREVIGLRNWFRK